MADPVAVDTWGAEGVKISQVTDALAELRHQSSDRSSARTAVMTLVAVAPGDEQAYLATNALRSLGGHHPARIVILRPDSDQAASIGARTTLFSMQSDHHVINFEEVILSVRGQAANHLDSVAEAFTLSDLPVAVWYVSAVPDPTDPLLTVATALLLDSRDAFGSGQIRTLLELARRRTVVDLSWIRLGPWRELLSGLFDPPEARPWVDSVETVEVRGKGGPRQLLGGWLAGQLGLRPRQVTLSDARHVEIHMQCRRGEETASFAVERAELHRTVAAQSSIPGQTSQRQTIPLADDPLQTALSRALTHLRPDPTWERALSAATSLTV